MEDGDADGAVCEDYHELDHGVRSGRGREDVLLGCQIGVSNFILGGSNGYSFGNERRALKNPPVVAPIVSHHIPLLLTLLPLTLLPPPSSPCLPSLPSLPTLPIYPSAPRCAGNRINSPP